MKDVMGQMRAAQPMPRGERLATKRQEDRTAYVGCRLWCTLWIQSTLGDWWFPERIRQHAAPLALARERRRRERAEAKVAHLRRLLGEAMEEGKCEAGELIALRAEVARLQPQPITGDTSDGYHTFNELYAHRIALWKAVCRLSGGAWRSKKHSDGSGIPGWFVLGMGREPGSQRTYHLPEAEWDACAFAETLDAAPQFDGHTSADVLARIDGIQPPTREEVERAVDEFEDAACEFDAWFNVEMDSGSEGTQEESELAAKTGEAEVRLSAARDALVKLATRART